MVTINLDMILKVLLGVSLAVLLILLFVILIKTISIVSKINILVEDVTDILKASKRNIVNSSTSVSTTLENIKNVSSNVAESSKYIANNFAGKTSGSSNSGGIMATIDTILDCWDIFKTLLKKKK